MISSYYIKLTYYFHQENCGSTWISPVKPIVNQKHIDSTDYKRRIETTKCIGAGSRLLSKKKLLDVIASSSNNNQKLEYLESINGAILNYKPIDQATPAENIDQNPTIETPTIEMFALGERKITGNDDIISEFQYIVNALLFTIQAKYDRKSESDFFPNFKTLIIDSISQVQKFNRDSYIHYDKIQNQTVVLQEMYSLLGTIRHGVSMNSFLVQSNVFNPFQFQPKIINSLQESNFAIMREQICHLFNSNNQSNRKGQTLIISESFLTSAYNEGKSGSLSLSAEEYSRFCQADVFISVYYLSLS